MLISFLGSRQETNRSAFYSYLVYEVENLEERDFQIFQNEAEKLFMWDTEQGGGKDPSATYTSRSSSTTYLHTCANHLSPAASSMEYVLLIPETLMPCIQPAQHTQVVPRR